MNRPLDRLLENLTPFRAADGRTFVHIPPSACFGPRSFPVRSRAFRDWFFDHAYTTLDRYPSQPLLHSAISHLEAQAARDPSRHRIPTALRIVAQGSRPFPDLLRLHLADPSSRYVEITPAGWQTTIGQPAHFEPSRSAESLDPPVHPDPAAPNPLDSLRQTLRFPAQSPDWLRCLLWLLAALRPGSPYPILILRGPSGSGKSVAARILRSIADPSVSLFTPTPANPAQLLNFARHSWILAFDHVARLSPTLSETLCRLSSGLAVTMPDDPHAQPAQRYISRPILLTVTDDFTPSPDLAARSLVVDLPPMTAEARRDEAELTHAVAEARPALLGAVCDVLSAILRHPRTAVPHSTRHAGALAWVLAAASALTVTEDQIRQAFTPRPYDTRLIEALQSLLRGNPTWKGTATDLTLLLPLNPNPRLLSIQLRNNRLDLAEAGISLEFKRDPGGPRMIHLAASQNPAADPQPESLQLLTDDKPVRREPHSCVTSPNPSLPPSGAGLQPAADVSPPASASVVTPATQSPP